MASTKLPWGFVSLLRKWWSRRFYNRLLFLSAIIFIIVVYGFGVYASFLITKLDTNSHLQRGRDALTSICDEYDRKHDNFYNVILPLYDSGENYTVLSSILERDGLEMMSDPHFKQRVVTVMRSLAAQDKDISAILMLRNADGQGFVYNVQQNSFVVAPKAFPFFSQLKMKDPFGRAIYGVGTWGTAGRQQSAYGIASGGLGTRSVHSNAGSVMVAYDITGLQRVYQKFDMPVSARFYIISTDGDVIFDSTMQLYGGKFPHMELLKTVGPVVSVDGTRSVLEMADHSNRRYYGLYLEADTTLNEKIRRDQLMIFSICTGVSLLSALLYLLSGLISSRRVRDLEHAMSHIGSNNLSYRVPLRGTEDEFEHIAARFNRMCDDLQDNVNRLYVNEIKQKSAELNALQSGINPHFLYNTLEAIRNKAKEDGCEDVAELIVMMSSLLRILVRSQMFIPIRQEMHFVRMYLDMFSLRYADRFDYTIDAAEDALDYSVPKGILQPVVENYFVHGIRDDADDNRMDITVRLDQGCVLFEVSDNGKGIDPDRLAELQSRLDAMDVSRNSYGLANVHERIRLVYGQNCGIRLESGTAGTIIRIKTLACTGEELQNCVRITGTGVESESA